MTNAAYQGNVVLDEKQGNSGAGQPALSNEVAENKDSPWLAFVEPDVSVGGHGRITLATYLGRVLPMSVHKGRADLVDASADFRK
jgi:hypothetical protein